MAAVWNRAGHYIFAHVVSIFFLFFLQNTGLKCGARGSLEIQDAKIAICAPSPKYAVQLRN